MTKRRVDLCVRVAFYRSIMAVWIHPVFRSRKKSNSTHQKDLKAHFAFLQSVLIERGSL